MSKYIIEIEDVPFSKVRFDADNGAQNINLYRAKGFNALVFDEHGLNKLTPLNKELDDTYQKGLDDAWKFAGHLAYMSESVTDNIYISANGGKGLLVAFGTPYEDAKKEHDEYFEKKQKADERIMFGDGLVTKTEGLRGIALSNEVNRSVYVWREDCVAYESSVDAWKKTGETYPQIEQLLEMLKGERRNCSTCKHQMTSSINCVDCYGYEKWEPKGGAE